MTRQERIDLTDALMANAGSDGEVKVYMDQKTTSFIPHNRLLKLFKSEEAPGQEAIRAIGSIPCHY